MKDSPPIWVNEANDIARAKSVVDVIQYRDGWWVVRKIDRTLIPLAGPFTSREGAENAK